MARCARALTGVDLSAKMLDKARELAIYQRPKQLERGGARRLRCGAAADVFVYNGKLHDLMEESAQLLPPGG